MLTYLAEIQNLAEKLYDLEEQPLDGEKQSIHLVRVPFQQKHNTVAEMAEKAIHSLIKQKYADFQYEKITSFEKG